ncbi:3-hydroxylacyl-ACP dehydratase [Guyparkeria hydrothermalis]|uniref:3-hydroxylacyl-ACP dehydratase n=1 Tax=Guyparkeria hydrothermalis TaxID=923 RepID=UPI00201FD3FA|nr:3-hydroxylacyl-ACP dehydratase [Guyparkeria hydrothermalis]MCL7743810.1 3-hydroxylacyl-ACP dehydratase [Guyparkeria hydrothermalis]
MSLALDQLTADAICALLPHAGGVCQIEAVSVCDENRIVCTTEAHRRPDNPLRRDERLSVHAGIEIAGQAMALHMALLAAESAEKHQPRQGMITRLNGVSWTVDRLDTIEGPLTVTAECQTMAGQVARYGFALMRAETCLLKGTASVFLADQD